MMRGMYCPTDSPVGLEAFALSGRGFAPATIFGTVFRTDGLLAFQAVHTNKRTVYSRPEGAASYQPNGTALGMTTESISRPEGAASYQLNGTALGMTTESISRPEGAASYQPNGTALGMTIESNNRPEGAKA